MLRLTQYLPLLAVSFFLVVSTNAQNTPSGAVVKLRGEHLPPVTSLDNEYLEWPLSPQDAAYGRIDGRHLKEYVKQLAAISEHYRDQGHQFWGRITGTASDAATQKWVEDKYKEIGLKDIRVQSFNLPPQWMPHSWDVTAVGGGKTLKIESAQPTMSSPGTPSGGLDLEAVYAGTGSEADFAGRDVKGKAVVIYSVPEQAMWDETAVTEGGTRRAEEKGAAAVFIMSAFPGNMKVEMYPTGNHIPTFAIGNDDGIAIRDMIGNDHGQPPHIKVRLDVQHVPNLKTATIWGTLPGNSDESIIILAHRDGFFDGGTDDASGMATQIGLAEYFAKIPQAQRRRNIIFISTTGHHNDCKGVYGVCSISATWIADHHAEVITDKTALIINCEHVATTQTYLYLGPSIRLANSTNEAAFWYVGGSNRLRDIAMNAYKSFGYPTYWGPERSPAGEMGTFYRYAPSLQVIDVGMFAHSDMETPEVVPWTGLESVVRAYAKIVDQVNKLNISDLRAPASGSAGQ